MLYKQTVPPRKKVRKSCLADLFLTYSKDTRIWRKYHICTNQINTKCSVKWIECGFVAEYSFLWVSFGGTLPLARLSTSLDVFQVILWFWSSLWRQCLVCPLLSKQKIKKTGHTTLKPLIQPTSETEKSLHGVGCFSSLSVMFGIWMWV